MTLHVHHLMGCAPAPLAHYLKALGVLRIVGEQADSEARGWWQDEHFCLMTRLDRHAIERFFLERYEPTPFVSPWNKGSGFYDENDKAMLPLRQSTAPRFASFRRGIEGGRVELAELTVANERVRALKDRTKARKGMSAAAKKAAKALKDDADYKRELAAANREFSRLKADVFTPYLRAWRGPHRDWLDATFAWLEDQGRPSFASLLGTGGNDGRLDFTNNAMQRLGELFELSSDDGRARPSSSDLLATALWASPCTTLTGSAIGQFYPGSAGGANSTTGPDGGPLINPWDFILMLEGSILLSTRATRRLDPSGTSRASAPFAVRAHAVGHGSPGRENAVRGEQWMPLWNQPATLGALRSLLGEARMQLGRQVAHRPLDVARAVARLGVARGLTSFVRFGYLERIGQSQIAVPLGRIDVRQRPRSRLVDDLSTWLDRLRRVARADNAPARLSLAERALANAVFAALTHDESPGRWQAVLLAASAVEAVLATGTAFRAGPIPPLSPEWLDAADDGSTEWRLACALGSAAGEYKSRVPQDPVRHHWLPLQRGGRRFAESDKRLTHDPRVVMTARNGLVDFAALVERRLLEASQRGQRTLPLIAREGYEADPRDLAQALAGSVDLERVSALARALMALRWTRARARRSPPWRDSAALPEAWIALRLASLPWPVSDRAIPVESAMIRRLRAGDGAGALEIALRRLRAAGCRPPLQAAFIDERTAHLWGASLAFPVGEGWARRALETFDPQQETP
jgi:CRISPR-associated protein Csx17